MDRGEVKPSLTGLGEPLEILSEAAPAIEPGERALDDPPPWQHDEATGSGRAPHDLELKVVALPDGRFEFPPVGFVGPDPAQAGVAGGRLSEDQLGAVTVLEPCRVDRRDQQQPERIDQQVALAAGDLFFPRPTHGPRRLRLF